MLEIRNLTQAEIDKKLFHDVARVTLETVSAEGSISTLSPGEIEISLAIIGNSQMKKLNKIYRGKNRVTDVLAFDNKSIISLFTQGHRSKENKFIEVPDGVKRLGEIIICHPRARKQAKRLRHSLEIELTILLIHGILHLLGYDHEKNESEAKEMERMEDKIFKVSSEFLNHK